jgi:Ankyrin repeats (3 copies)
MTVKPSYDAALPSLEALFTHVPKPPIEQLLEAVRNKDTLRLLRLMKEGAPVNGCVIPPLLVIAAEVDRPKELKELIAAGADVNAANLNGETPLMAAVIRGRADIVELLLKEGAYIEGSDYAARTPLMRAAFNGSVKIVELLLQHGASTLLKDNYGQTALDWRKTGARASRSAVRDEMKREECDCYKSECKRRHKSDYELECDLDWINYAYRETKELIARAMEREIGATVN